SLFLVTAKHVFSGCNGYNKDIERRPDLMNVYIPEIKKFIKIKTKNITDTTTCSYFWEEPDIISFEINDSLGKYVYSLENYFIQIPNDFEELKLIGYPSIKHPVVNKFNYVPPSNISL